MYSNDAIDVNNKSKINITPGNVRIGNTTTLRDRILTSYIIIFYKTIV